MSLDAKAFNRASTMTLTAAEMRVTLSDYDRTKTLRRSFMLLACIRDCSRTLAFLAAQLGVCERTVRRDLYTLEQAGIPLLTEKVPLKVERRGIHGDFIMWMTAWRVMPGAACPICRSRRPVDDSASGTRQTNGDELPVGRRRGKNSSSSSAVPRETSDRVGPVGLSDPVGP